VAGVVAAVVDRGRRCRGHRPRLQHQVMSTVATGFTETLRLLRSGTSPPEADQPLAENSRNLA